MKDQPNYYAVITANVLFAEIHDGAKLLYGLISGLVNQEGYCWATNQYFADIRKVDKRTIQRWLDQLVLLKAIIILFEDDATHSGRKIYINTTPSVPPTTPMSPPHDTHVVHNNINNNTLIKEPGFKTFFKQPNNKKPKGHILAQAREICAIFTEHLGGDYNNTLHLNATVGLIQLHGLDRVKGVALFGLSVKKKEYQAQISNPIELSDKWPKIVKLMENPPKEVSKYGIRY